MTGEAAHLTGQKGVHRAKQWLDASTRVKQSWTCYEPQFAEMLTFSWPAGSQRTFSFDIGGQLRGGGLEGEMFLAEVKAYKNEGNLPTHYQEFLAKCYVAYQTKPVRCDHLMWISWSPFRATKWSTHTKAETLKDAVIAHRQLVFGVEGSDEAEQMIDPEVLVRTSERLWLITLCEKQEQLVISKNHLGVLSKYMIESGEASS